MTPATLEDVTMTTRNDEASAVGDGTTRLVAQWDDVEHRVRQLVDARPLACVLAAVAAGYMAARLTTRL